MRPAFALLVLGLCALPVHAQDAPAPLAFANATVVDVRTGRLRPGTTVLVEGKRITGVGRTGALELPESTRVIDAGGKYVIPGLIDTHAHLFMPWLRNPADTLSYLGRIVATGVTAVRDAVSAGLEPSYAALRAANEDGRILAPKIHISAIPDSAAMERLGTRDVRETIRRFGELGVDGIKLRQLSREAALRVIAEAKRAGMPVYGHTQLEDDDYTLEAVRAGIDGVMHAAPLFFEKGDPPPSDATGARAGAVWYLHKMSGWLEVDEREMQMLIDTMVAHGTWLEPTLTYSYLPVVGNEYDAGALRHHHPWYGSEQLPFTAEEREQMLSALRRVDEFVRRFHRAGGMVLAGTDQTPFPPLGVTEEMRRLVDAGLTPLAALQAATINAARALQLQDGGTVEVGKVADLVLLDDNPLVSITNVRKVFAVVANGRYLDRSALEERLVEVAVPARGR